MAFFDSPENSTGALVPRLAAEPTALQELLSVNVALLVINAVNLLASAALAVACGWKLGLVLALGALPVLVAAGYARIRLEFRLDTAARFAASSAVASLALEPAVVARYERGLRGVAACAVAGLGAKMFFYALSQSVSMPVMALGFWYDGRLVSTGEYSSRQFYTVFVAVVYSGEAAALLFQYSTSVSRARTATNYVFGLRGVALDDDDHLDKSTGSTHVVCDAVEFAYPLRPRKRVLGGIDLAVPPGAMVALVGASGCGKSTVIGLLERFYDPTRGELRADGRPLVHLGRAVALVQQEPVLFRSSVRDNVLVGAPSDAPADDAAVDAWEFVASLPAGLDIPLRHSRPRPLGRPAPAHRPRPRPAAPPAPAAARRGHERPRRRVGARRQAGPRRRRPGPLHRRRRRRAPPQYRARRRSHRRLRGGTHRRARHPRRAAGARRRLLRHSAGAVAGPGGVSI